MKIRIGNGRRASLWYDNWHPLGPLEKILGEKIIRESRLSRLAKVADIVEGDTWRWPSVRFPALSDLIHAFILWLAIQGGIYTQTKLLSFGLVQSMRCVLCGCSMEDLDHLFFACPFSERVWNALHAKCNLPRVQRSWLDTLSWMEQFRGRSMSSIVIRLMTHGEAPENESTVIQDIVFTICARVNLCRSLPTWDSYSQSIKPRYLQMVVRPQLKGDLPLKAQRRKRRGSNFSLRSRNILEKA
ncbi:uncharacterized protein LOC111406715 [Olea europaea var. sylvestris]|uniref:uncharacterized protein LOC111406715 n=1 Tax=Olea europaea var. sylvestris TaxID=158386 RepID=UPI000C1D1E98|nr:uncharacterized protein LOC111406715 [Olea europaea var. sylvestris]